MAKSGPPEDLLASLIAVRERLVSSLTLTTDRLQDTIEDAVKRGRMTRRDAEELLGTLVALGRSQTDALLADVEELLARGAPGLPQDVVRRGVTRARRHVTGGSGGPAAPREPPPTASATAEPLPGYDALTASQVVRQLTGLTPAQLRAVRDREVAGKSRKTVLAGVERRLGSAPAS